MLEMGVHTAKAFESPPAGSIFLKVRDHNGLVVANDDMGYPALAVDQDTELTAGLKRKLAEGLRKFWGDD